jgi:TIP41-like family
MTLSILLLILPRIESQWKDSVRVASLSSSLTKWSSSKMSSATMALAFSLSKWCVKQRTVPKCKTDAGFLPQRVMPSCLLVLQRFFLRVDKVVFRLFDSRIFVPFETGAFASGKPQSHCRIIRDLQGTQCHYETVKAVSYLEGAIRSCASALLTGISAITESAPVQTE